MRIFKTRIFARFARKVVLTDTALSNAMMDAKRGLIDADLGGGVIKQRIARRGDGKSGGFRTIVLFRLQERAVFVYGFEKSARDNIQDDELQAFRRLARQMLSYDDTELAAAIKAGVLIEVRS